MCVTLAGGEFFATGYLRGVRDLFLEKLYASVIYCVRVCAFRRMKSFRCRWAKFSMREYNPGIVIHPLNIDERKFIVSHANTCCNDDVWKMIRQTARTCLKINLGFACTFLLLSLLTQ
jgi:hypothetical protein